MPMSLKCIIGKWLHKGQISQEEYDAVIKKLDGHDKQIKADAIDEFMKALCEDCKKQPCYGDKCYQKKIAEQLKKEI